MPGVLLCTGFVTLRLCLVGAGAAAAAETEPPAQPELRLSLHDAIEAALDNNPKVRLLKEQIQTAQGIADTSRGALMPNLSGFVNQRNQTVNLATFGIPTNKLSTLGLGSSGITDPFNVFDARATIVQNIFSMSLIQRWRAARTGVEVASLEAEIAKRDATATVALLYMEALRAEAAVKAGDANVELSQRLLKLAQDRKKSGVATGLDVTREQVHMENEKQRLLVAQSDRDSAKLNLIRALGIDFDVRLTLAGELKLVEVAIQTPHEVLTAARANRVELKAQATREKLAALSLSSVTSERLPSLNVNGDYGMIGLKAEEAYATRSVGVTLSIPVFDGGQREGRVSEGRSKVRQESIRMKDVSDQVTLEVRNALITLASSRQQVSVSEEGLKLALRELELARDRFEAGIANNIEVTNAQTSVARARDNVIEALFRFNASRVNLARAQGQMETLY